MIFPIPKVRKTVPGNELPKNCLGVKRLKKIFEKIKKKYFENFKIKI